VGERKGKAVHEEMRQDLPTEQAIEVIPDPTVLKCPRR